MNNQKVDAIFAFYQAVLFLLIMTTKRLFATVVRLKVICLVPAVTDCG